MKEKMKSLSLTLASLDSFGASREHLKFSAPIREGVEFYDTLRYDNDKPQMKISLSQRDSSLRREIQKLRQLRTQEIKNYA